MLEASLLFAVLAFIFSIINFIELRAQKLSTHNIQYIDPFTEDNMKNSVDMEKLNKIIAESNELNNVF